MMRKLQPAALLIGLAPLLAGPVGAAAQSPPAAASLVAMPNTPCFWLDQVPASSGTVTGVQCPLTSSLAGSNTTDPNPPIALFPSAGIIELINTWLVDHAPGYSIQQTSYVGIEALGGQGRNGDSRPTCTSGGGAGSGYAITVQQLSGMQSVIQQFAQQRYASPTVPPPLYVFVGKEGVSPGDGSHRGGGAASWVFGQHPDFIPPAIVVFPSQQTNSPLQPKDPDTNDYFLHCNGVAALQDGLVFVIGAGGGG